LLFFLSFAYFVNFLLLEGQRSLLESVLCASVVNPVAT